jgi:hypothetical protein
MPATDFLTNVETAFLSVFAANDILKMYNWQRWDSDVEVKLPRGHIGLSARTDPEESAYQRVQVTLTFEGRPKKHKFSVVVNELKSLFQLLETSDLDAATGDTVKFLGKADVVTEDRRVVSGLRTWVYTFAIYAVPIQWYEP